MTCRRAGLGKRVLADWEQGRHRSAHLGCQREDERLRAIVRRVQPKALPSPGLFVPLMRLRTLAFLILGLLLALRGWCRLSIVRRVLETPQWSLTVLARLRFGCSLTRLPDLSNRQGRESSVLVPCRRSCGRYKMRIFLGVSTSFTLLA